MKLDSEIVVVGGSSGSLEVVQRLVESLDKELAKPLILILHRANNNESHLADVLSSKSLNKIHEVKHFDQLENKVYLAPANYHLLISNDKDLHLDFSEKVAYSRPSIDVSFESFSSVYKNKIIGVVLCGANQDGAKGAAIIEERGGHIFVQNPKDCTMSSMPECAIKMLNKSFTVLSEEDLIKELKSQLL